MQLIPLYLVPNRVTVTTDRTGFYTEFRKVYQRTIKLYKGIDNTIELEIRNSDQKRQDVMTRTVELHFFDQAHKKMFTATGTGMQGKFGIMSVTVTKEDIENITPQMLNVAAKFSDENILYSDSQFGLFLTADILDGFNEKFGDVLDVITVFNYSRDSDTYTSEVSKFGTKINDDFNLAPTRSIRVDVEHTDFTEKITVEATQDKSTAYGTTWTKIGEIEPQTSTTASFEGDWRYVRFVWPKYKQNRRTLSGTVDKITVRN